MKKRGIGLTMVALLTLPIPLSLPPLRASRRLVLTHRDKCYHKPCRDDVTFIVVTSLCFIYRP